MCLLNGKFTAFKACKEESGTSKYRLPRPFPGESVAGLKVTKHLMNYLNDALTPYSHYNFVKNLVKWAFFLSPKIIGGYIADNTV